ncbi:hypothetical protein IB276_10940 [Ensifer sp. ENS04]|uniref:hypothetical protein n=1 Tax=Ensifer sp. ENS04 TaxID=2769281 RepID=UPI0017858C84|nr:hypothetical protein [Ensifer sp. ENS04]MBD9539967.1 hypothetical protein [Ensifer sp. ENS04]
MTAIDFTTAYTADRLARAGTPSKELGRTLNTTTARARQLATIGARKRELEGHRLTMPEQLLLQCLVDVSVSLLRAGEVRSPESKIVSGRAGRSDGWAAATAQKRLCRMGFVHVAGNGYMTLTPAGWMLVHAMSMVPND